MNDEELEKTKPIEVLSDLSESRMKKYKEEDTLESRASKYKEKQEKESKKEEEEAAEEALAEKNIAMAEAYLEEENRIEEVEPKKEGFVNKIKGIWDNLEKKQKIMIIIIAVFILILIVISIIFAVTRPNKEVEEKPATPAVEEVPVITDNYYYKNGNLYFLDESEKEIGSYECENKDNNLCYVTKNNYRDTFDVPKLENENGEEEVKRIPIYDNKYVFVSDNKEETSKDIKLYSIEEQKVVSEYKDAKAYDDNYIIVADKNSNYGLIKIEDGVTEVIKPAYSYLGMIDGEDNLVAKSKKGFSIINKKGKVLSSNIDSKYEIKSYNDNFVVLKIDGEYGVVDYKGTLIDSGYDYIMLNENYAALVDSDKKVYVIDSDKNKYNEGNISLNNDNYVKRYIYDESGSIKEIKRSFEINVKDATIEMAIYEEGVDDPTYKALDKVEGLINQRYKYVNYFDGKLYFYSDEAKMELIGSYSCSTKNYVTSDKDDYTYCFVAKDVIYEDNDMMSSSEASRKALSPLINNKFVFVTDGTDNVKLYDLIEKKVLGTYTNVNTYTSNNDYKFTKVDGKLDVVALNKKGKYGMLTIDGENVSATYSFDYQKIEKLKDYYAVQEVDGRWKIIFHDGESEYMDGKVVGYSNNLEHFKTVSNNSYTVYNESGDKASLDTYAYVELQDDYYVGVNNEKTLYVYDYQGNKLTEDGVTVGNYPYTKTDKPAFKVKKSGSNYIVSIYDGSKYNDTTLSEAKEPEPAE